MVRQVSRMSTEGEAAPAADAPAEGEPLPEVVNIADHTFNVIINVICLIVNCHPNLPMLPLRENLCLRLKASSFVSTLLVIEKLSSSIR